MPLVVDQLQLWTIGFKWAGLDPNRPWLRIPTPVRDNFSTLLEAILSNHLECLSLVSEKYAGDDPEIAKYYIRYWLEDVNAGIHGQRFDRKLLKHAVVERGAFQDWCERRTIPLPGFWFPPGWTDYRWPEQDFEPIPSEPTAPASDSQPEVVMLPGASEPLATNPSEGEETSPPTPRPAQLAKIICKQIAKVIWKEEPAMTIAEMCRQELILKYGGGQHYTEEVVRRWVKEVAPSEVSAKPGRPKKKTPTQDE